MFQTHRDSEELTALYEILTGTADATGEKFFDALVGHMSKALGVAYAFVSVFTDRERRMRILAFYQNGQVLHGIEYEVTPTPCSRVIHGARISDLAPLTARVYTLTRRSATISPPERDGG